MVPFAVVEEPPVPTIVNANVDKPAPTRIVPAAVCALFAIPLVLVLFVLIVLPRHTPARVERPPVMGAPQRIVAMGPNSAEIICALGACDAIVGVSKFCVFPPVLATRPKVGGLFDPDLEAIAGLRPDLVVLRGRSDSLARSCEQWEVPTYADPSDSLDDVERAIEELGLRLERQAAARSLIATFRSRIAAIRARVADQRRVRVLLTVSRQAGSLANLLTTGPGTFLHEAIEIAGGENVFGDLDMRYPQVGPEAIVAKNPEFIVELMPGASESDDRLGEAWGVWAPLSTVHAVRTRSIAVIPDDNALIPSPRYVDIIERLSELLHPPRENERDGAAFDAS